MCDIIYAIYSVGVVQIEVGTCDHFGVFFFVIGVVRKHFANCTCQLKFSPLPKSAVLRYYYALGRLAWPYQFLGSVVESRKKQRRGTVQ